MKVYKKNKEAYLGSIADISEIIRIAVSTRKNTPNPYYVLRILGKDEVISRFSKIINKLS
jgi:glutamyl-tRNA synthetase